MQILPNCALIPNLCETCTCAEVIDKITQLNVSLTSDRWKERIKTVNYNSSK